jgi:hypothetical protein
MNTIDELKEEIEHKKNRIKFGFNLIRSMEKRIESKDTKIEEFKLTAEPDLIKSKYEARKCLITAIIVAVFNIVIALHFKLIGMLTIPYLSNEIAYAQTGSRLILEGQIQPTNVFSGDFFETLKYSYLSYEKFEIFTFITVIVISAYLLMKLSNYSRSICKRSVQEHIEIYNTKLSNKMHCYHGYTIKVREEIQQDRLLFRKAKYKLRLLERN